MKDKTELVLFEDSPIFAPDFNLSEVTEMMAEIAPEGISQFDIDRIKIPAGGTTMWQYETLEGDVSEKVLLGIPIAIRTVRAYWNIGYDESGGGSPPDCNSSDGRYGQGDPGGECSACPLAAFGSADKGGGQACKHMRLIFLLRVDSMLPSVLIVPPTSLKVSKQFFLRLAARRVDFRSIVAGITLEKTKSATGHDYGKLNYAVAKKLTEEQFARVKSYAQQMAPLFGSVTIEQAEVLD